MEGNGKPKRPAEAAMLMAKGLVNFAWIKLMIERNYDLDLAAERNKGSRRRKKRCKSARILQCRREFDLEHIFPQCAQRICKGHLAVI